MKIDVEGFELFVLRGASLTLQRTECVYFELSGRAYARYGYSVNDVFDLLTSAGFEIYETYAAGLRPFTQPRGDHQNVVALRPGSTAAERLACARAP
jgi:hypothetical protein